MASVNIPPLGQPISDTNTGLVNNIWHRFFMDIQAAVNAGIDNDSLLGASSGGGGGDFGSQSDDILHLFLKPDSNAPAKWVPISDAGSYFTGADVETALQEIYPAFSSNTQGSSGASLVGLQSLDGTAATVQLFADGSQSSQYYSGGLITENGALDGTIDISELTGYIKLEEDTESLNMAAFTISASSGVATASGNNFVCVDLNVDTPVFLLQATEPNGSTVFPIGKVFKDDLGHLHILQGGYNFLGLPQKLQRRLNKQFGLTRTSGLVTTESSGYALGIAITSGYMWQGLNEYSQTSFDSSNEYIITGAGTGGTVSANNTIVLDSTNGDVTDHILYGQDIVINDSSNGNDGTYHVESVTYSAPNTTVVVEETTLTTGADTGDVHYETFGYWHYDFSTTSWVRATQDGSHSAVRIDVNYWNDIDNATEFQTFTAQRYGTAWVYKSADGGVHVVYGQGDYTLAQATAASPPASLPDIINNLCYLVAKIVFQEGAASFYEIYYPWATTFSASGATDHGGLAGLLDDDHPQYIKGSEFTADSEILVGTGSGTFQKESGATARTSLGAAASGANADITSMTGLDDDGIPAAKVVSCLMQSLAVADLNDSTTPSVLTTAETTNTVISNYKSTGADHVFTMPAAHAAGNVIFVIGDEFQVDIEPDTDDLFYLNGTAMAANEHIQNTADTLGQTITGVCANINGTLRWMFYSSFSDFVEETP